MIIEDQQHIIRILHYHLIDGELEGWCCAPITLHDEYGTKEGRAISFFGTDAEGYYDYQIHFHMSLDENAFTMVSFTKTDSDVEEHTHDGFSDVLWVDELTELFDAVEDKIGAPLRV